MCWAMPQPTGMPGDKALSDPNVGIVLVVLTPNCHTDPRNGAAEKWRRYKHNLAAFMGDQAIRPSGHSRRIQRAEHGTRAAAEAISMWRRHHWPNIPNPGPEPLPVDRAWWPGVDRFVEGRATAAILAKDILAAYGVPPLKSMLPRCRRAGGAQSIGYPVVMKIASPHFT
jgi:hypothetical protein